MIVVNPEPIRPISNIPKTIKSDRPSLLAVQIMYPNPSVEAKNSAAVNTNQDIPYPVTTPVNTCGRLAGK